jgi:hypothetical protein
MPGTHRKLQDLVRTRLAAELADRPADDPGGGGAEHRSDGVQRSSWMATRSRSRPTRPSPIPLRCSGDYGAPGHIPLLSPGAELIEFSPTEALQASMAVLDKNMAAMKAAEL